MKINPNCNYEYRVIDKILNLIKDNQEYLTETENLPQLAKLGYMYNSLWYAGRVCWGYQGKLRGKKQYDDCEDNPKYKIEMCQPKDDRIENLIYDAWGMHVSNDMDVTWEEFSDIVLGSTKKPISELRKKELKVNKTMDEWVELLTDKAYKYPYANRHRVLDHLLCVIGNGYGYKDGFVISEAGGADQDIALYGDWQNALLRDDINEVVKSIMEIPEVQRTIEVANEERLRWIENRKEKERKQNGGKTDKEQLEEWKSFVEKALSETKQKLADGSLDEDKIKQANELIVSLEGIGEKDEIENHSYYPICEYSIITMLDENSHPSYIKAGLEICDDIIKYPPKIGKDWNQYQKDGRIKMIKFAEKFTKKYR